MKTLDKSGAYALFRNGHELHILKYHSQKLYIALFVSALLSIILLFNAFIQFTLGESFIASLMLLHGILAGGIAWWLTNIKKRKSGKPQTIAIFDLQKKTVFFKIDNSTHPLQKVKVCYKTDILSSNYKMLIARTTTTKEKNTKRKDYILAQSHPFSLFDKPFSQYLDLFE
ncbi:MAG: hypothetical protein JJT94_03070 [Bernardetiaceae bacterium]|nr:hypothetical protein [Bernardetiaceae bacterium]